MNNTRAARALRTIARRAFQMRFARSKRPRPFQMVPDALRAFQKGLAAVPEALKSGPEAFGYSIYRGYSTCFCFFAESRYNPEYGMGEMDCKSTTIF